MSKLAVPVTANDHTEGPATAPVTLVEYGDYQCPSRGDAFPLIKKLQKHFGEKLRFVFRNFPLEMHPYAEHAAETAEFAAAHDKFWEMHDLLFENQERMDDRLLVKLAGELHLAPAKLKEALEKQVFQARVRADFLGGVRSGVNGTPTFFINDQRHTGPYDFDSLVAAIEHASSAR